MEFLFYALWLPELPLIYITMLTSLLLNSIWFALWFLSLSCMTLRSFPSIGPGYYFGSPFCQKLVGSYHLTEGLASGWELVIEKYFNTLLQICKNEPYPWNKASQLGFNSSNHFYYHFTYVCTQSTMCKHNLSCPFYISCIIYLIDFYMSLSMLQKKKKDFFRHGTQ